MVLNVEVELLSDAAERPKLRRVFGDAPRLNTRARHGAADARAAAAGSDPALGGDVRAVRPARARAAAPRVPAVAVALGCRAPSDGSPNDENKRALETELPLDPASLSHRVASRAPVSLATRYALLCADTAVDRLRLELKLFGVFSDVAGEGKNEGKDEKADEKKKGGRESICLSCSSCSAPLSALASLVAMSDEGAGGAYCNPAGLVHDVLTVGEVFPNAVALEGEPSAEFSWFPGFAWTVAVCVRCRQHLGWQFTPEVLVTSASEEATTATTSANGKRGPAFAVLRVDARARSRGRVREFGRTVRHRGHAVRAASAVARGGGRVGRVGLRLRLYPIHVGATHAFGVANEGRGTYVFLKWAHPNR